MTVGEVIEGIAEELGLTKVLSIPGGGNLEYVLEEVWIDSKGETLQESDEEDDDEGTAKLGAAPDSSNHSNHTATPTDRRGSLSQKRLSNLFDGWLRPASPTSPTRNSTFSLADNRKSVSEPKLLQDTSESSTDTSSEADDVDEAAFKQLLDDMGITGERRNTMHKLPASKKAFLLQQHHGSSNLSRHESQPSHSATYGPSSGSTLLPRLVPQLTGDDGLMRRFSIVGGWGGPTAPPVVSPNTSRLSGEFDSNPTGKGKAQVEKVVEEMKPLQPQITGGLWSRWWASSGGEKPTSSVQETNKPARWYVEALLGRSPDSRLVKHLISLRVHLSTAKMVWIEEFVIAEKGLDALGSVLAVLPGFNHVLRSPTTITHIAYALHASSLKLRTLVSEVLAAIALLSPNDGHKTVLSALSDYRVAYDEGFRFEGLISSLRLPDLDTDSDEETAIGFGNEEEGVWEARTASLALVNALTNSPESLEDRMQLREEFGRRGLNEVIVALRYLKPPDSLLTQLDVYTEEKFEDEEDMQERFRASVARDAKGHERQRSESELALEDLIILAKQHGELYPMMVEILNNYGQILQRDVGIQLKADLFAILDRFVEQAALLDNFDDSWQIFMKRFAASVQHITGQELDVKAVSNGDSLVEQELEGLRNQVEELSDERTELREELNQKIAEINTLKSLPLGVPAVPQTQSAGKRSSSENFHGVVQRLVQKEKQVIQLQAELDRFKVQNPNDGRGADERAKRERDRVKWNALMEEIAKLKTKSGDLELSLTLKDKEITYLKRALESVYTRFISREEAKEQDREKCLLAVLSVGNALNGSTFRGGARGFQLDALLKLKETKTAKGTPDCPTLLHYLAKVFLRTDPSLVNFIEELPNLEPAARVSVQTLTQSVNSLVVGLDQMEAEIRELRQGISTPDDQFIHVMQPFVQHVSSSVDALKNMSSSLDGELRSLLTYFGEDLNAQDAPKPEDFFGLIVFFSTSLQKSALEVHDAQEKCRPPAAQRVVPEVVVPEPDIITIETTPISHLGPPPAASQGYAAGLRAHSIGRGDLDQAIRSMREGKRRARPARPLSKIFLDGAGPAGTGRPQSRIYD
ncbi:hypothetical protein C0991_007857 [Blastosporella zonata]|nr:hypothetical protein C0991_007857 [Blastosporella zonata]